MDILLFTEKLINRLSLEKNFIWQYFPINYILKKRLGSGKITAIDLMAQLHRVTGKINDEKIVALLCKDKDAILYSADEIINGRYELLGSGPVDIKQINWHKDFKSGYCWEKNKFYRKYKQVDYNNNADVKVPRELSRCHQLLWLGEAFMLTNNDKYAEAVIFQINNWIDENPSMYSINWGCAMDVAIRAINWVYSLSMLKGYKGLTDSFASKVYYSLYQHMFFINNNKERNIPYSNNHYISDIIGLLVLSIIFKNKEYGKRTLDFALKEAYSEIRTQVLPSGVQYERSTSYHRLVSELFVTAYTILIRNGYTVPADIKYRITSMLQFIKIYTKPNGFSPLISDNDDGRILPFIKRDYRDHSYMVQNESIENIILYADITDIHKLISSNNHNNKDFSDAGFCILKNNNAHLFITNGDAGLYYNHNLQIVPTHTHNDLLSFDLNIYGKDIIIDSGSYIYTADYKKRNEFRSTAKHNTIVVDGEEQNELLVDKIFYHKRNSEPIINKRKNDSEYIGAYTTIVGQMTHKRLFTLADNTLDITDYVHKKGNDHLCEIYFHFDAEIVPISKGDTIIIENEEITIQIIFNKPVDIKIVHDTISPSYGVLKSAKTAIISFKFDELTELVTQINWNKKLMQQ